MVICFTGHRPDKLGGYDWNTSKNKAIMQELHITLCNVIGTEKADKYYFVCGGALGIDQMAFEIVNKIKTNKITDVPIKLILAMPFEKQDNNWFKQSDKDRLRHQREIADKVVLVDTIPQYSFDKVPIGEYHPAKMQLRNQYMVDKSNIIIAVWNGTSGGTANCVRYAKSKGKQIILINPDLINL